MPTDLAVTLLTERDLDILAALDMVPLTAGQLCKLSRTFRRPFPDGRRARERLRALADAGRVRAFRYATAGPGAPACYVLTPLGYRLLHGLDAVLPARPRFAPVGIALQRHTIVLAEFIVHTAVAAHTAGVRMAHFRRENAVRLDVGEETIYPDAAFQLVTAEGRGLNFLVELDCGIERVRSDLPTDSWERKVRLYERYADRTPTRFRVLAVCTGGETRVGNVLAVAKHLAKNPRRSLVYGVSLPDYLGTSDPVTTPVWGNHHGARVPLLAGSTRDDR